MANALATAFRAAILPNAQTFLRTRQPMLWLVSLVVGLLVAIAAVLFRLAVELVHEIWLDGSSERLVTATAGVHWFLILLAPTVGGLVVGLILQFYVPTRRASGIADVIESRAAGGRNISLKPGLISAAVSAISLGSGASAGREGPMVHLGATLATSICQKMDFPGWARRTLLACGVASAISASFNAPIAGVLFAHEVVLQHYSKRSFIPIVMASVMGTILSRLWFGEDSAFAIPDFQITSYLEFPAFALLGLVCALVAILFQFGLIATDSAARRIALPLWFRPVLGGLLVGAIAIFAPQVLGVGYEATSNALTNNIPLSLLIILIIAKSAATAITLASRFGGGIVSPSLYIGAMTGGAFGLVASSVFPELASSQGLYAILGMGAVAAAVIGAPISTAVMVFELTGGYALSIALLLTVGIAVGINQAVHGRSFFQWQLEGRGIAVMDGPHRYVGSNIEVASFMKPVAADEERLVDPEDPRPLLRLDTTLEMALRTFDDGGHERLGVVSARDATHLVGTVTQTAALQAYNRALVDISVEEHR
jgi:CIC family chloride channel protein